MGGLQVHTRLIDSPYNLAGWFPGPASPITPHVDRSANCVMVGIVLTIQYPLVELNTPAICVWPAISAWYPDWWLKWREYL